MSNFYTHINTLGATGPQKNSMDVFVWFFHGKLSYRRRVEVFLPMGTAIFQWICVKTMKKYSFLFSFGHGRTEKIVCMTNYHNCLDEMIDNKLMIRNFRKTRMAFFYAREPHACVIVRMSFENRALYTESIMNEGCAQQINYIYHLSFIRKHLSDFIEIREEKRSKRMASTSI